MISGLIDLNTTDDVSDEVTSPSLSPSPSYGSDLSPPVSAPAVCCLELWHACAGPLISLPKKGNAVVYFPQGHLEQRRAAGCSVSVEFDISPHVFCRVVDVKLHAEAESDDVYVQVSLIPDSQLEQKWSEGATEAESVEDDDVEGLTEKSTTPHMFCKTLTASDTSTHGGFSVPRRAAEDCFPPLDYKQQRPSQELVAKDLHGTEWKFRHIYRGQPRRHLLTTGWSAFVNKKKLVCGDAVLFLRGDDGVLRLGIRRAAQVKSASSFPPDSIDFTALVNSISQRHAFSVYYNPRGRSSEFIVPYHRFVRSLANSVSPGMRFKMRVETDDAADRRSTGIVTGITDMDPVKWPGSKWRCLMVRWDGMEFTRQNTVSPWEIERCNSISGANNLSSPITKRIRTGFPPTKPGFPVSKDGALDFGESLRIQKVLQGQEIFCYNNYYDDVDARNHCPSEVIRPRLDPNNPRISHLGNGIRNLVSVGFGESLRFNKVLQGQEIHSNLQYGRGPDGAPICGNEWTHNYNVHPSPQAPISHPIHVAKSLTPTNFPKQLNGQNQPEISSLFKEKGLYLNPLQEESVSASRNSCRLFGFSLTEGSNSGEHTLPNVKKVSILLNGEEQAHHKRPILNPLGASCTIERVHQWCRPTDSCLKGS